MAFGGKGEPHPEEVLASALAADPRPVVLLTGGTDRSGVEPWFVDTALARLIDHALGDASRDFNFEKLRAEEASSELVVSRAETMPMMAKRRVVAVTDIDRWKAAEHERVVAYLKRPSPSTVLIFTSIKLDRRTSFAKALEAPEGKSGAPNQQLWRFRKLEPFELAKTLAAHAKKSKKKLDPGASEEMIRRAGEDLRLLLTELDKLIAYVGDESDTITEDHVALATAGAGISDVFAYADALGSGNVGLALERLQIVLDAGASAFELIGGLAWHFRTMLRAKSGNAPQFGRMRAIADAARTFPTKALLGAHHEIYLADATLKSAHGPTGLKDEDVMNRLTRRICQLRASG